MVILNAILYQLQLVCSETTNGSLFKYYHELFYYSSCFDYVYLNDIIVFQPPFAKIFV